MISVLIVNYNGRDHLEHCLERLAAQPETHDEVIVVDNASDDDSVARVRTTFPDCRLLELERNVGFGSANNLGAKGAKGDFLLLLNSDAWLEADALPRLVSVLEEDPGLGLVAPQLRYPEGGLQFTWAPETGVFGEALQLLRNRFESRPIAHRTPARWLRPLLGPGWLSAACILIRRSAFEAVGGFDERLFMYFEDVDLSRRLRQAGWRLGFVPEAEAYHVKGGSQPSFRGEIEYRRAQLYYYCKHRPAWENRLLRFKLRHKFSRMSPRELRRELLTLLDAELLTS